MLRWRRQPHLITGPLGSGKSTTLLYLLGALERPTAGSVLFEGRDLAPLSETELPLLRRTRIGFVRRHAARPTSTT